MGRADDPERRAVAGGGERPGVAVREDPRSRRHQLGAVVAEGAVGRHVLREDRLRLGEQTAAQGRERLGTPREHGPPHAVEGPEEVDGGRSRGRQALDRSIEIGEQIVEGLGPALPRGQGDAEGGGDADGRRPPHDEGADRVGDVFPATVLARQLLTG